MNKAFQSLIGAPAALKWFVAGRLTRAETMDASVLRIGEGAIVQTASGKVAVYRDEDGRLHGMSPVCTHLRCIVAWNSAEKTWDCPCHGSRYDAYGHVINGPARRDLSHTELD